MLIDCNNLYTVNKRTLAKMKPLLNEEGEEEVVLEMEEWDNLRPKNWELNGVEVSDDDKFWGWINVGKELVGRVREALAMDEEEQSGNMLCCVFFSF